MSVRKPCPSCPWRVDQDASAIPNFPLELVLNEQEWADIAAVCSHFLDSTRWVDHEDHSYRDEHIAKLLRQRALCERVIAL